MSKFYLGCAAPYVVSTIDPSSFFPWQRYLHELISDPPSWKDRKVLWFWNPDGNSGKSAFAKYMVVHKPGTIIVSGKSTDILHAVASYNEKNATGVNPFPGCVIVDCPRVSSAHISFAAIESIKNGLLYSGKYEGAQFAFNSPHVIVFANCEPDYNVFSVDRWFVRRIDNRTKDIVHPAEMD